MEGIVAARDPFFFPEQEPAPHRPDVLLLFEAEEPDHVEDVKGFVDRKIEALLAHESQFESTMAISGSGAEERAAFERRVRDRAEEFGALAGLAEGEAFKAIHRL